MPIIWCRVVAARARAESLSDEVAALELEDCPIRMAAHPSGNALVLALGGGGLSRVNVARGDGDAAPSLSLATGGWISRSVSRVVSFEEAHIWCWLLPFEN